MYRYFVQFDESGKPTFFMTVDGVSGGMRTPLATIEVSEADFDAFRQDENLTIEQVLSAEIPEKAPPA